MTHSVHKISGGMAMTINGVKKEISVQMTLLELLQQEGFQAERIAVERNGEIVPRASYGTTWIGDGDQLEVVSFVGGG